MRHDIFLIFTHCVILNEDIITHCWFIRDLVFIPFYRNRLQRFIEKIQSDVWYEESIIAAKASKSKPSYWVIYVACVLFLLRFGPPFITRAAMPQIQIPAQYFLSFIHPSSYYHISGQKRKIPRSNELRKVRTVHICTCHKCQETYMLWYLTCCIHT